MRVLRRHDLAAFEIDQPVGQAIPDRAPHVLLDHSVRLVRQRLALVDARANRAPSACISAASACASARSGCASQIRTSTVGNARCGRTLHHSCVCSSIDACHRGSGRTFEAVPAVVRVRDAATGKQLREDLRAHGVQPGGAVLDERRARREREQLRQDVAERVADGDSTIRTADADVRVQPKLLFRQTTYWRISLFRR